MTELRLSTVSLAAMVFRNADGEESEIVFEDRIVLRHGRQERVLNGSRPGADFDPKELAPLLELLGNNVTDAVADKEGRLRIAFANAWVLEVVPSTAYEAWHFQYPRPGRPAGGNVERHVGLTGANGRLI